MKLFSAIFQNEGNDDQNNPRIGELTHPFKLQSVKIGKSNFLFPIAF